MTSSLSCSFSLNVKGSVLSFSPIPPRRPEEKPEELELEIFDGFPLGKRGGTGFQFKSVTGGENLITSCFSKGYANRRLLLCLCVCVRERERERECYLRKADRYGRKLFFTVRLRSLRAGDYSGCRLSARTDVPPSSPQPTGAGGFRRWYSL